MSGTFPTSPKPARISFRSIQPTIVNTAISGRRQSRQIAGHRWGLTATWGAMKRADFMAIYAFLIKQRGQYDAFTWVLPTISTRRATTTAGSPTVNGASQTGRSLAVSNFSEDGVCMKAGDLLKLASADKVYMVTEDATASSGNATISIEPALVASPSDGEAVTVDSVPITLATTVDLQEYALGISDMVSFELDLIESL